MSIHEQMESIVDVYVAGGLSADERRDVDQHMVACTTCASLLRDAREFSSWTKGVIKNDAPPADLEDRMIARFRAAGQSKRRRFPVGKRFFKVTGSIAAAVVLIFLGNAFTDTSADGYLGAVRERLAGMSGVQDGESKLRSLTSAEADFRGTDRDWGRFGWHFQSNGKPSTESTIEDQSKLARLNNFEGYFGRDLSRTTWAEGERGGRLASDLEGLERRQTEYARDKKQLDDVGVDVINRGNAQLPATSAGITGVFSRNQDRGVDVVSDGMALKVDPAPAESAALGMAMKPSFAVEAEKLTKERLSEGKPDAKSAKLPQSSTLAAAYDEAKVAVPEPTPAPKGVQDNRKIIRTAEVSIEVESYDATYTKLSELMTAEKGLVSSANTNKAANGKIAATVVLRVPPERFEAVLAKLKDFGTIRSQNVDSEDVTKAYVDLETRMKSKEILADRLKKLLAEGKGNVKELMEVEVQLGATNEAIESLKGEIKYYDNRIGLSTLTLQLAEKDLGQPFEYVQTLHANLALTVRDPDDVYAKAQKEITDAGGQVVDSRMTRQNDGSSVGSIRGRVDADKFQALRESLKKHGVATNDTVNQQKTARGGHEGAPKADAPLRKEQAILDLTISSPPIFVTRRSQILVETATVDSAYQAARRSVEGSGGKIVDGNLVGRTDGMQATLRIQIDADKFQALVDSLKSAGKVKNANINSVLPAASADGSAPLLRERAEIDFALVSPPELIGEEHGLWKSVQDTFAKSWAGLLWSIEKLFVGISLAGPWVLLAFAAVLVWRKRKKAASSP